MKNAGWPSFWKLIFGAEFNILGAGPGTDIPCGSIFRCYNENCDRQHDRGRDERGVPEIPGKHAAAAGAKPGSSSGFVRIAQIG
jgi:hypothetical protein